MTNSLELDPKSKNKSQKKKSKLKKVKGILCRFICILLSILIFFRRINIAKPTLNPFSCLCH